MRVYALYIIVALLSMYAYRDWFKSLCGLILLMAVIEHPDMPKTILGIQGLNPWNVLLANVVLAWFLSRRREGLTWDMPRYLNVMLMLYLLVMLVSTGRMLCDRTNMDDYTFASLISENVVNTIKWLIPALLIFDGCRTKKRLYWVVGATLAVYLLLALQVVRWVPPSSVVSGAELTARSRKIIMNEVGYHAVNMSMMLAGASWAVLAASFLARKKKIKLLIIAAALVIAYGQALTAGRMGYVTWGMVGLILCTMRWRKLLLLMPVFVVLVVVALPGVSERMVEGFGESTVGGGSTNDDYQVTSGRTIAWPYVIDKIAEAPVFGYGKLAMKRTGISDHLFYELGESFPHPHNAYLQWLLDNGLVGFLLVMPFFAVTAYQAGRLFLDKTHPAYVAVGGVALSLLLAQLIASLGSQTFYPREGAVGMWIAMALVLRVVAWREQSAPIRTLAPARRLGAVPSLAHPSRA